MDNNNVLRSLFVGSVLAIVFGCVSPSVGLSQDIRHNKAMPSVYLSFRDVVNSESIHDDERIGEGVRLVLHNNTPWAIYYYAIPKAPLPGDVPLIYGIEEASGCPADTTWIGDVLTTATLRAGKEVSFVVPRDHLSAGTKLYVEYAYSWERIKGRLVHSDEPVHRAYFSLSDLPKRKG